MSMVLMLFLARFRYWCPSVLMGDWMRESKEEDLGVKVVLVLTVLGVKNAEEMSMKQTLIPWN